MSSGSSGRPSTLSIGEALALGLIHGPAELLPISSSAHISLLPWLAGWEYSQLDPELRKSFEVTLHAGTAVGLLAVLRHDLAASLTTRRLALIAAASVPPAVTGLLFERVIERHGGTPNTIACALLAGSAAMVVADLAPERRGQEQLMAADALWLGIAQSLALLPGISRSGATVAMARLRRFKRTDASILSHQVGLPVILGASALRAQRLRQQRLPRSTKVPLAVGALAAFASTLVSSRVLPRAWRDGSPMPVAAYRAGVATAVLWRRAGRGGR